MKEDAIIAGFGGQGILLMGQLLAETALRQGFHTTWFPSYGPEMRGGTANCTTMWSDEEIGSPICAAYTVAVVMNQPSLERFAPRVLPGELLLVNETMVPVRCPRRDISMVYVPAGEIARNAGNEKVANVVMLGALLGLRPTLRLADMAAAIESAIGAKYPQLVAVNQAALQAGSDFVTGRTALVVC